MSKPAVKTPRKAAAATKPPWEQENPKTARGEPHGKLTPAEKADAERHAKSAGRPYPNLVDNMWESKKKKEGR